MKVGEDLMIRISGETLEMGRKLIATGWYTPIPLTTYIASHAKYSVDTRSQLCIRLVILTGKIYPQRLDLTRIQNFTKKPALVGLGQKNRLRIFLG